MYNWNFINHIQDKFKDIFVLGYRYHDENMFCPRAKLISDIDFLNIDNVINNIKLSGNENVYVSIDLDVIDPSDFPGTNFKVAGGINIRELLYVVRYIIENSAYCIVDICEFNPLVEKEQSLLFIDRLIQEIVNM